VYAGLVGPFRVTDPAAYGSTYASGQRLDGECLVLWSNASPAGTFLPSNLKYTTHPYQFAELLPISRKN
jgi:hypothetical protein